MKWGIISPRSRHFQNKMRFAFEERNCLFASRTPGRIAVGQQIVDAVTYEELLGSDVDCVYVCTPTATHDEVVAAAIEAGKNVLVEKMAGTTATHRVQVARAKKAGILLDVAFQSWFSTGFRSALDCYRNYSGSSTLKGEAQFHLPMDGIHPDPVHDVAYYPLMVAACLSRGALKELSFGRAGNFELAELVFDDIVWSLSFSIDADWRQAIRIGGLPESRELEFTRCFTGKQKDPIYQRLIDQFEMAASPESKRTGSSPRAAIDQLARVLPVFDLWEAVSATRDQEDRTQL